MPDAKSVLFKKCDRTGCINRAMWGLKICVPSKMTVAFEHPPITALVNVVTCGEHITEVRFEDFANERILNQIVEHLRQNGKAPPDFRRGYMDGVPLDHPEWLQFQNALALGAPQ